MRTEQQTKCFVHITSETEGEVVHVKLVLAPPSNSLAVVLLWFYVA